MPQVGLPATLAGFEDTASFLLMINEQPVARLFWRWTMDGRIEARSTVSLAGQTVETTVEIIPDADGRWREIVIRMPAGVRTAVRNGTAVRQIFRDAQGEKAGTFDTEEGMALFDDNCPALISQSLRLYDRERKGKQKLPLLISGHRPVELTIEAAERVVATAGGRRLALTRFIYVIPGVDLRVLADETGKVYVVDIPVQKSVFVRDGFQELLAAEPGGPFFDVAIERGVRVPMRDGIALSTDIYRPIGVEIAPVILFRTPYKKELLELEARFYVRRGYIFAAQDCRGKFASPGFWEPFVNEGCDGYDTIEWMAAQSWCSGKVGMVGLSYSAIAQWLAAVESPPHLAAMIPNVSPPDPFYNFPYEYGAFFMWANLWWSEVVETAAGADLSGAGLQRISRRKYAKLLNTLPVIDLDRAVLSKENRYWREWIAHPKEDEYWQARSFRDKLDHVKIPVLHQSGWFDGDGIGSKLNYLDMQRHGHPHQKLILGPWGHTHTATRMFKDRDFGERAIIDLQQIYLRWFDRWLKDEPNGIEDEPLVSLFVMGANEWRHGSSYPLESSTQRRLYLAPGGRLTFDEPEPQAPYAEYIYDPADPTPAPAFYEESEEDERKLRSVEDRKREAKEHHRLVANARSDILVYETDPLAEPLAFTGPLTAVLHASTTGRDADWFVTLCEVNAEGEIFQLTCGKIRARFRKSMRKPELLSPGGIYRYTIDLWQTGIRMAAGAKLRVEVAGAAFPLFSRNLNTGGHNETETEFVSAVHRIYHDRERPSYIEIPVIE